MKHCVGCLLSLALLPHISFAEIEVVEGATIKDSPTTLMGVNHIGLSVKDLDTALAFYQGVTGFELIRREVVRGNSAADALFNRENIEFEVAVLEAPNMLFELTEFSHNRNKPVSKMPVQGPGMTHTCFQTPSANSGYDLFKSAGADILSTGDKAVDLGGYGVTYAYGYDAEGNMFEMEQLDQNALDSQPYKNDWLDQGHKMWMTQVALVSHDIDRITNYYQEIMAFPPYRKGDYVNHPRMNEIVAVDNMSVLASWFRMNDVEKSIEIWQYRNPVTEVFQGKRDITEFGYSFSIEVGDIQKEYQRMKSLDVEFVGEPVRFRDFWQVYANDIDGNVFSLRQAVDPNSPYSVPQLDI